MLASICHHLCNTSLSLTLRPTTLKESSAGTIRKRNLIPCGCAQGLRGERKWAARATTSAIGGYETGEWPDGGTADTYQHSRSRFQGCPGTSGIPGIFKKGSVSRTRASSRRTAKNHRQRLETVRRLVAPMMFYVSVLDNLQVSQSRFLATDAFVANPHRP